MKWCPFSTKKQKTNNKQTQLAAVVSGLLLVSVGEIGRISARLFGSKAGWLDRRTPPLVLLWTRHQSPFPQIKIVLCPMSVAFQDNIILAARGPFSSGFTRGSSFMFFS